MPYFIHPRHLALVGFALLLLIGSPAATAWGFHGHRVVAELADVQLNRNARQEVARLLGAASLADVAPWADQLRNDPQQRELGRATARLHYLNFADGSCQYSAKRDCAGGKCVVAAIDHYAAILGDRSRSDADRAEALRFVVHFVGDVHQPLHASPRDDKGGNTYQVNLNGKGSNLHAVWDTRILASRKLGWRAHARTLAGSNLAAGSMRPAQWAEESCAIVRDGAIYPSGHVIDDNYLRRMRPRAEQRLQLAGARLAVLLNKELGNRR
ncbi:MAG: S1/P1 nuclease [Dokdonella sp.]